MWANIQRQRSESNVLPFKAGERAEVRVPRSSAFKRYAPIVLGMAATLVVGVAIGRYGKTPSSASSTAVASKGASPMMNDTSAVASSASPTALAMAAHLARTEALLTSVKNDNPSTSAAKDVAVIARDLLGTTRLLLDDPTLDDARTRRLLQDLELVLVQLVQSRAQSPAEARRVPRETLQETNLLPRLRAAKSTAQLTFSESSNRGIAE